MPSTSAKRNSRVRSALPRPCGTRSKRKGGEVEIWHLKGPASRSDVGQVSELNGEVQRQGQGIGRENVILLVLQTATPWAQLGQFGRVDPFALKVGIWIMDWVVIRFYTTKVTMLNGETQCLDHFKRLIRIPDAFEQAMPC